MNAQTEDKVQKFAALLAAIEARLAPNERAGFYRDSLEQIERIAGTREKEKRE